VPASEQAARCAPKRATAAAPVSGAAVAAATALVRRRTLPERCRSHALLALLQPPSSPPCLPAGCFRHTSSNAGGLPRRWIAGCPNRPSPTLSDRAATSTSFKPSHQLGALLAPHMWRRRARRRMRVCMPVVLSGASPLVGADPTVPPPCLAATASTRRRYPARLWSALLPRREWARCRRHGRSAAICVPSVTAASAPAAAAAAAPLSAWRHARLSLPPLLVLYATATSVHCTFACRRCLQSLVHTRSALNGCPALWLPAISDSPALWLPAAPSVVPARFRSSSAQ